MNLSIALSICSHWLIDDKNILDSTNKLTHKPIFKFSYHPATGEFLVSQHPQSHADMIRLFGHHNFPEYVRGIWLKHKNIVYLRMHEKEDYLQATEKMLREHGVPKSVRIIWGEKAQEELKDDPFLQ
jgi:hypothetical protein